MYGEAALGIVAVGELARSLPGGAHFAATRRAARSWLTRDANL